MPFNFQDLDKKLQEGSLTFEDVIRKALAINLALRRHLVDKPNFRNHVFQGYIAWVILYNYLSTRAGFNAEITKFLILLKENLDYALKALNKNMPIREYIMKLNEAEIVTRPNQRDGKMYLPYSDEKRSQVLNFLRDNKLTRELNGNLIFNPIFYLFYRKRDGRFFLIADRKIDFSSSLNLDSCFADDLKSTHVCMNEGIDCKEIYKSKFEKYQDEFNKIAPLGLIDSKDEFFYCGEAFKNIELSGEITAIELCKNPPAEEIHCLYLTGCITTYKKEVLQLPEQTPPVSLHITIGRKLRKPDRHIADLSTEDLLNLLSKCDYAGPLLKQRNLFATEDNFMAQENNAISRYGLFPLVSPREMLEWKNVCTKEKEVSTRYDR